MFLRLDGCPDGSAWLDLRPFGRPALKPIAIDGKTRALGTPHRRPSALHLVSAWAAENHLTLGQVATDEKSNEITAIPQLLELLDLEGPW